MIKEEIFRIKVTQSKCYHMSVIGQIPLKNNLPSLCTPLPTLKGKKNVAGMVQEHYFKEYFTFFLI
jgi:hypothetical protein